MKAKDKIVAVYKDKNDLEDALERIERLDIDVEKQVKIREFSEDEIFEERVKKQSAKRVMVFLVIVFVLAGVIMSIIATNGGFGGGFETHSSATTFVMICGGFCLGALAGMVAGMVGALIVGPKHYSFKDHFDVNYYTILLKTKSRKKAKKVRDALDFNKESIKSQLDSLGNH
ncbi:MAG: hypothetical protein ACI85I_000635 [Arenicella sp.]|jgi:hypothetical protein